MGAKYFISSRWESSGKYATVTPKPSNLLQLKRAFRSTMPAVNENESIGHIAPNLINDHDSQPTNLIS
jgi:hypothetical protein